MSDLACWSMTERDIVTVKKAEAEDLLNQLKNITIYMDHEALDIFFKLAHRNLANPEEVELQRKR